MSHTVKASMLQTVLSVAANIGTVHLALVLYYVLETACVVCMATYLINFLILLCNVCKWRHLSSKRAAMHRTKKQ